MRYTTLGRVRGCCGHEHRTLQTAERCLREDERGCKTQGGYSDRRVVVVPDGEDPGDWSAVTAQTRMGVDIEVVP